MNMISISFNVLVKPKGSLIAILSNTVQISV